jgi:hypothetical protein
MKKFARTFEYVYFVCLSMIHNISIKMLSSMEGKSHLMSDKLVILPHGFFSRLDGYLESGIAAGVDPTLSEEDKLPIHGRSTQDVYNSAVA